MWSQMLHLKCEQLKHGALCSSLLVMCRLDMEFGFCGDCEASGPLPVPVGAPEPAVGPEMSMSPMS